jgi:Zn-dependent protease with chaperone function
MNFFEHQSLARRNTRVMVLLFVLAVLAVIAAVDAVLGVLYAWSAEQAPPAELYLFGAAATAALIFCVSLFNIARLASGGVAVARMVGARRVAPDTADPLERRLRNVVEEMAIASGVRVPEVYVMDAERGINAFAAGWDVSGAVVAVTRGTLETLTRDELQGVVAHEFSHIMNGDMRLNVRMIGVLAGIVFIGAIGEFVMRSVRGSRSDGKGAGAVMLAGLALLVIGYVGLFFARLIKAAVSRQREFLADASSVQFTRNPDGIAGALDQIRSAPAGARIANRYAEELSHMFFGEALQVRLGGLLATHPPLEERIRRVHPRFQRDEYRARREAGASAKPDAVQTTPTGRRSSDLSTAWGRSLEESVALVGALDGAKVDHAARLLRALPPALRESVQAPEGAAAAILALMLAAPEAAAARQLAGVPDRGLAERARAAAPLARGLGLELHLPVIDLALAALRAWPEPARKHFVAALEAVVYADRRVSLHEFVVLALVRAHLLPGAKPPETKSIAGLKAEAATVLGLLAHASTRADAQGAREEAVRAAIEAGAEVVGIEPQLAVSAELSLAAANAALQALRGLTPMQKGVLVKGLFAAVTVDGTMRVAEAGLMRVVGAVLDCPLPPLLESLDPATLAT